MADRSGAVNRGRAARASARTRSRGGAAPQAEVKASDIERLLRKAWKSAEANAGYQLERNASKEAITQAITAGPKRITGAPIGRRRTLGEQFTDQVKMMPSGLWNMAGQARATADGLYGLRNEGYEAVAELFGRGDGADLGPMEDLEDVGRVFRAAAPLAADQGRSFANTWHRVTNPEEYGEAVRDGRILDVVTEDAANVSLVAGGAARLSGAGSRAAAARGATRTAAGLGEASQVLRQFSTLGATAADAPILPLRLAANTRPARFVASQAAARIPQLDPVLRAERQFQRDTRRKIDTEAYQRAQLAEKIVRIAPDPDVQIATDLVAADLDRVWSRIPDERLDEFADRFNEGKLPEQQVSANAMRIARDYTFGDLDPKTVGQMDQVIELMTENRVVQTERALRAGLQEQNLEAEPLTDKVDAKVEPLRRQREREVRARDRAEARARKASASVEALGDDYRQFVARGAVVDGRMVGAINAADENLRRTQGGLTAKAAARERDIARAYKQLDKALETRARLGDKGLLASKGGAADGRVLEQMRGAADRLDDVEADIARAFAEHELNIDRASGARAAARKRYERKQNQVAALGGPQDLLALDSRRALMAGKKIARAEDAAREFANAEYARKQADATSPPSRNPESVDRALQGAVRLDERAAARADRVIERMMERIDRMERAHVKALEAEGGGGAATRAVTRAVNADERLAARLGDRELGAVEAPKRIVEAGRKLQRARTAQAILDRRNKKLESLDAKIERTIAEVSATPEAMPARFRTVRNISDWSADALERMADEGGAGYEPLRRLAQDMRGMDIDRMVAEGFDPVYLAGGSVNRQPVAPGQNVINRDRPESFLKQRTAEYIPFGPVNQLKLDIKQLTEVGRNEGTRAFVREFATPARDIIGDGIDQMNGEQIAGALRDAGFEAYDPKGLWAKENPMRLKPDALAIKADVHADLTKSTIEESRIVMALSAGNRKFKNTVLPFSVRWHTGNTIGGALMAMVGGGVDPITLVQKIGEVRKRGVDDPEFAPLRGMSMAADVQRFVNPGIQDRAGLVTRAVRKVTGNADTLTPGPIGRVIDKSYRLNDTIDSMYRSAIYLAKRDQGLSPEQAVKVAIDAMGDYGKLTTVERRVVKNILPFYPWTKHITTLAFRLPIEHPMRVVWTLHLAEMFGEEPDPDAPPWEQGGFSVGGRYIGANVLNPFDGIGTPLGPAGLAQSVTPIIKVPVATAFGLDVSNMDQISRPGEFGVNPLSPREAAAFATNEFTVLRNLRELIGDEVAYDDLGKVRTVRGEGVYANYQTPDENGLPSMTRRAVRDDAGNLVMQPDQPIRTANGDWDVLLSMFGAPRNRPDRPTSVPLELPAEVTRGGLVRFAAYGDSDGYLRGSDGKLDYVSLARALRTLGLAQQSKPPTRTELDRIAEENGVVLDDEQTAAERRRSSRSSSRRSSGRR